MIDTQGSEAMYCECVDKSDEGVGPQTHSSSRPICTAVKPPDSGSTPPDYLVLEDVGPELHAQWQPQVWQLLPREGQIVRQGRPSPQGLFPRIKKTVITILLQRKLYVFKTSRVVMPRRQNASPGRNFHIAGFSRGRGSKLYGPCSFFPPQSLSCTTIRTKIKEATKKKHPR